MHFLVIDIHRSNFDCVSSQKIDRRKKKLIEIVLIDTRKGKKMFVVRLKWRQLKITMRRR